MVKAKEGLTVAHWGTFALGIFAALIVGFAPAYPGSKIHWAPRTALALIFVGMGFAGLAADE